MTVRKLIIPLVLAVLSTAAAAQGEEVEETYPDGKRKAVYRIDKDGRIHGRYNEYHDNGQMKIRARYVRGQRDGAYESWYSSGLRRSVRKYKAGTVQKIKRWNEADELIHEIDFKRGRRVLKVKDLKDVVLFPRGIEEVLKRIEKLDPVADRGRKFEVRVGPSVTAPFAPGALDPKHVDHALRRANVYRYLCGVAPDLRGQGKLNELAQHAALVCAVNKAISHFPPRPTGMTDAIYGPGATGAAQSNLHIGQANLRQAIDGFMDDSDPKNIRSVGHRRWILSPELKYSGLGFVESCVAMHVQDASRRGSGPLMVSYPAPGYFPIEYIAGPSVAWHFGWDASRLREDPKSSKSVECWLLDDGLDLVRRLDVRDVSVATEALGGMSGLVFRPVFAKDEWRPGLRVLVKVKGFLLPKKASPNYVVEFFRSKPEKN
jgi:cysteine-rich secretory family protein